MQLTDEQKRILDGKSGKILQQAMQCLVKYGAAMGAEELIPITSAHTLFKSLAHVAEIFSPQGAQMTDGEIAGFGEELSRLRVKVRTTTNPSYADLDKWRLMGADETTYKWVKQGVEAAARAGIMATSSCTPYLAYNIPQKGEHCSWSESSAFSYCNSMLGGRSNRDGSEASLASALLGVTPNFGMHLDENRKGTHLVEVKCEMKTPSDWGALGYVAGELAGVGIPVFTGLRRPTVEEAKQLSAGVNTSGATAMFHIAGVTPEAPTLETAFGSNTPKQTLVFDGPARQAAYAHINSQPEGKVDLVFLGCPLCTLHELKEIARMLEGKRVASGTRLWVATDYATRYSAERLGWAKVIEASGAVLLAGGCAVAFNNPACKVGRMAADSAKQANYSRTLLGNKVFFGDTQRCIDIAAKGGTD